MEVIWQDEEFEVVEKKGFHSLLSKVEFQKGDCVCIVEGEQISHPNRYSVQVGEGEHINVKEPVMYINHDCSGNIELVGRKFIAIKKIKAGEEITFDYNKTEDELAEPFVCFKCGKEIKGKKFEVQLEESN